MLMEKAHKNKEKLQKQCEKTTQERTGATAETVPQKQQELWGGKVYRRVKAFNHEMNL